MNNKTFTTVYFDEDGHEHEYTALSRQTAIDNAFAYNEKYHLSAYVVDDETGEVIYDV